MIRKRMINGSYYRYGTGVGPFLDRPWLSHDVQSQAAFVVRRADRAPVGLVYRADSTVALPDALMYIYTPLNGRTLKACYYDNVDVWDTPSGTIRRWKRL